MNSSIQYRGFAHCHSDISYDGKYSYAELKEIFKHEGLHFVCMTEHIEHLSQSDIDAIVDGCRAHSDQNFLFVPGIEMDEFVVYFIGVDHVKIDFSSSKTVFDSLSSAASMCVFSHPIKAKYRYPQWLMERCDGVEVWNTKHDGIHAPRKQSRDLLAQVREIRPHAVPLAGMDFHEKSHLSPANIRLLNSGPLTEDFVLGEIRQGRYEICKQDKNIFDIPAVDQWYLWFRVWLMDQAHAVHLLINKQGITVPKPVKRWFRKIMEGK